VDLVPFGSVASPDGQITWPSDQDTCLNVLGFEDACRTATALAISVDPKVSVRVASATGLVILKFIAWEDRRKSFSNKDAVDLRTLIKNYLDSDNLERLISDHRDIMAEPDLDHEFAGARLLGRDLRQQLSPKAQTVILAILEREIESNSLAVAATRETHDTELMAGLLGAIREELSD
jgi:predicted nucleotidyltransferase